MFIGRTGAEAEVQMLGQPNGKSWLIWKDTDAGKHWRQEEKGLTEDEMVGWHHWLDGHGFGWTRGVGDGQGGLACCSLWDHKELDTTERLNWTELKQNWSWVIYIEKDILETYFGNLQNLWEVWRNWLRKQARKEWKSNTESQLNHITESDLLIIDSFLRLPKAASCMWLSPPAKDTDHWCSHCSAFSWLGLPPVVK